MNLYFQDESRFGLMTHVGKFITAKGVEPIVKYQHKFKNTYLFGSYSPITGSQFVWEIDGLGADVFEAYLYQFSCFKPKEFKIVVIDNASYHTSSKINIPDNIFLLNIPPYTPELNPCEQIWQFIKQRFKNRLFLSVEELKQWLHHFVVAMTPKEIKSITSNHHYLKAFYSAF